MRFSFEPKAPRIKPEKHRLRENDLNTKRMEGWYGNLARAIEMVKHAPGVKMFLGKKDKEIGFWTKDMDQKEVFLTTGEAYREPVGVTPEKSVAEFRDLVTMTINVGRFGEGDKMVADNKTAFINFVKQHFLKDGHVLCLQDFRIDRDRDVLEVLKDLGCDYYANTFGQAKSKTGEYLALANVTIINRSKFNGYNLTQPELSITPNFQRAKIIENGKPKYVNREPFWNLNYSGEGDYLERNHFAFQALNTEFRLQGVDGELPIHIANLYNSPPSQIVDRIKSIIKSMKNIEVNSGFQVTIGDFNTYGIDSARKHLGKPSFPLGIGINTAFGNLLERFLGQEPGESKALANRLKRYGVGQLSYLDGNTLHKGPGKILGLKLDHCVVPAHLHTESEVIPVSFTDHRVRVDRITRL
jgi:hypothetical protein